MRSVARPGVHAPLPQALRRCARRAAASPPPPPRPPRRASSRASLPPRRGSQARPTHRSSSALSPPRPAAARRSAAPFSALLLLSIDFDDRTGIVGRFDFAPTFLRGIGFGFSGSGGTATLDAARGTPTFDLPAPLPGSPVEPIGVPFDETIDGEVTKSFTSGFARLRVEAELDGALTPGGALPGVISSSLRLNSFDQGRGQDRRRRVSERRRPARAQPGPNAARGGPAARGRGGPRPLGPAPTRCRPRGTPTPSGTTWSRRQGLDWPRSSRARAAGSRCDPATARVRPFRRCQMRTRPTARRPPPAPAPRLSAASPAPRASRADARASSRSSRRSRAPPASRAMTA